jgi:hypothetical protein
LVFSSRHYGFSVRYPRNWHLVSKDGEFQIFSFPRSRAVRGAVLPEDGAGINVVVSEQIALDRPDIRGMPPQSLEDWAQIESRTYGFRVLRSQRLDVSGANVNLTGIELIGVSGTGADGLETVDWFFMVGKRMFLASLYYWQGNPDANKLSEILKDVALGVRSTR